MTAARRFAARSWRVARAVWRFARAHSPRWLPPVLAACLFVPGPADEVIVLLIVLFLLEAVIHPGIKQFFAGAINGINASLGGK